MPKHATLVLTIAVMLVGCTSSESADSVEQTIDDTPMIELVGEGTISTDRNQTFPAQDPTDGSLWFSVYENSFSAQTIMFAEQTESGWSDPRVAPFSGDWGDRAPRFSPDGSAPALYFTSNRPRLAGDDAADMNIWRVARLDGRWGTPELVESAVNSDGADIHASVTNNAIWVASNRDGGSGRSDIYRVASDGSIAHLPENINDELSQPDLYVSPDESWMILVITDHPEGYGGDDLYLSRFDGTAWSIPQNLGPEINSAEYEYGPTVSADGAYLYFTSHRDGPSHVYRVQLTSVLNRQS